MLVDGDRCENCSFTPVVAPATGADAIDVTIDPGLDHGVHVVQVQNPAGYPSNEMPVCVSNVAFGQPLPPVGEESCRPPDLSVRAVNNPVCPAGSGPVNCACNPGADGTARSCGPNAGNRRCAMTLYCFNGSACDDAVVTGGCAPL